FKCSPTKKKSLHFTVYCVKLLMCRGKAVQDFRGPDCRFLKIKTGETIYVYYKLSGRRNNLWAGSVNKEGPSFPVLVLRSLFLLQETDFVCFDGGPEIFDHVDLDQLGGGGWVSEALQKDIDSGFERTPKVPERNIETDGALEKLRPESSLPSNSGIETEGRDSIEDIKRNSNEARGSGPSDLKSSKLTTDSGGLQAGSWGDGEGQSEGAKDISQGQGKQWDSTERVTLEPEQMDSLPLLETSLGSTIDAVVTDDEVTRKVTALNEEPEFDVDDAELKDVQWSESPEKVPLLTYSDDQMQQQSGFLGEDMHQEGNVDRKQVGKSVVSNAGRISDAPDLTVITVDSERSKLEPVGRMDVAIEETLDKPHRIVGKLLGNVDGSIEESMGKLHGTTDPLEKMDGETLGNNNRVTEQVQYKTKDELPRGVSSDESDESTAKIIDVSSSDSNEIPERIQKSTSKDSEEARGILLLSMSKEENRLDVVGSIETDTATGERSGPTREDSRDTVTGILASDNPEMPPKEPLEAGKIIEPMSKSQDPELHKESEIKVKVLGLSEETGADEVGGEEGLEKEEEQVERFERQTLKQPDGEALMETGSSGKVGQTESDTKVDNSSASRIFENRSAEDGDTTSQDGTDGVLGQGRPSAQELGPEESRGEATMDRAKMGVNSEESLSQEAAGLLEGREGTMNEPGDDGKKTGKPLESGLEPEVDTIQEEMDEEQFNLPEEEAFDEEPYFVDSEEHEELLEDENAVVARMLGRDNLGGAAAADNDDEHEENILEEDGRDLEGKDPLNSAKVKEKEEFEDTVYGNKNTDLEDEDKIIADPEFNESVQQLTFLKLYFNEDHLKRLYGYFGLQHLLELEAMFLDLEEELRVTKHTNTGGDLEKALDNVLEVSESKILDQIENMLDQRAEMEGLHVEEDPHYDKETMLLDDIQELLYQIRQKYSTSRDSTLLGEKEQSLSQRTQGEEEAEAAKELPSSNVMGDATQQIEEEEDDDEEMEDGEDEKVAIPHSPNLTESGVQEEELQDEVEGEFSSSNLTASFAREEGMGEKGEEVAAGKPRAADRGRGEEPAEKSLGMKRSPSLTESAAQHEREEEHSEETSRVQQPPNFTQSAAQQRKEEEEGEKFVSTLPEDMKPGPDFYGLPWEPVLMTVFVGILTLLIFFWRTCLSVMTEKQLSDKIQQLIQEKAEVLDKVSTYENKVIIYSLVYLCCYRENNKTFPLLKEAEGWSERHGELNEQIKLCQKAQRDLEETLVYKDNEIEVCGAQQHLYLHHGRIPSVHFLQVKTTLKIIEEERDHFQAKLCDEIKARHELEEQIQQLEHDYVSTGTERSRLENEFKTMQQKLEILTELYHQKEMALQKKLTQEEVQRQEKEQKLSVADERALQAVEEVKMYNGGAPSPPLMMELPGRPPSVNAGRGFPRDRGDAGKQGKCPAWPVWPPPPREWTGPGSDRLGHSSDHGSPPPPWDRRLPGPPGKYNRLKRQLREETYNKEYKILIGIATAN
uniref:Uncharacterized protein n=1 Tax=Callorhinchus milii TaxID=7868 RepID=A0A4W3JX51_CALMI